MMIHSRFRLVHRRLLLPPQVRRRHSSSSSALPSTPSNWICVSELAEEMREQVRAYTSSISSSSSPVQLAGLFAVDALSDPSSAQVYADHVQQTLREDGIEYQHVECPGKTPESILQAIHELNQDESMTGILVYYPIFHQPGPTRDASTGVYYKTWDDKLRDTVCPTKDVEGLHHHWKHNGGQPQPPPMHLPCTALAVTKILERYHAPCMKHQTVTIVNRSEIFGKPLATVLAWKGATVYSVDEHSILTFPSNGRVQKCHYSLERCLQESTIVVTGVPHPDFSLPLQAIRQEETVTIVNVSEYENVPEDLVQCNFVPHVGKVTVAALEHNLIRLHQKQQQGKEYK
jgi:methylenetetrahydrofolate dehydrogenase (NAD+)